MTQPACWLWPIADGDRAEAARISALPEPEQFETACDLLHRWQAGRCAVCGVYPGIYGTRLVVDHGHETMLVRGLLCQRCNTTEGTRHTLADIFADYRGKSPAAMLGIQVMYRPQSADRAPTDPHSPRRIRHRLADVARGFPLDDETDALSGLRLVLAARAQLDYDEYVLIEDARTGGASWGSIGRVLGYDSAGARQGALGRYRRLEALFAHNSGEAASA